MSVNGRILAQLLTLLGTVVFGACVGQDRYYSTDAGEDTNTAESEGDASDDSTPEDASDAGPQDGASDDASDAAQPNDAAEDGSSGDASGPAEVVLLISGMYCGSCSSVVRAALLALDGAVSAEVTMSPPEARVEYWPDQVSPQDMIDAIERAGYAARVR